MQRYTKKSKSLDLLFLRVDYAVSYRANPTRDRPLCEKIWFS